MTGIRTEGRILHRRKQPRQARSRNTMASILEAAAQVFELRGYACTTTDAIAVRAGVSIGSLYQYFPSKDGLLVGLAEQHLAEVAAALGRVLTLLARVPPLERVTEVVVHEVFALHARTPRLHQVLVEEAPLPPALVQEWRRLEQNAACALARYFRVQREVRLLDPDLIAHMVLNLVEASAHSHVLRPPAGRSVQEVERETLRMLRAYLMTTS